MTVTTQSQFPDPGGQVGGFCGSKTGRIEVTVSTSSCEFPWGSSPETPHRQNMPRRAAWRDALMCSCVDAEWTILFPIAPIS